MQHWLTLDLVRVSFFKVLRRFTACLHRVQRKSRRLKFWRHHPPKQLSSKSWKRRRRNKRVLGNVSLKVKLKKVVNVKRQTRKKVRSQYRVVVVNTYGHLPPLWSCIVCTELWTESRQGEKWTSCVKCERWAHEDCTPGDWLYLCHDCEDSDSD